MGKNGIRNAAKSGPRMKRWTLPDGCDVRSVVMREITGEDEVEVAKIVAAKGISGDTVFAQVTAMKNESCRLAIVAVNDRRLPAGVPFEDMDTWGQRTRSLVTTFYNELNGVEAEELKKALAGGEEVTDLESLEEMGFKEEQETP